MSVLKVLLLYLKRHKARTAAVIISVATVTLLALVPAQILKVIVDDIIPGGDGERLLTAALVYAATYVAIGLVTFIKDVILLSTSQRITEKLRCEMMAHVQRMTYTELVSTDSGTLEAYFNNDVDSINELFTSGAADMATDLFKMAGIVISIFIFSTAFGIIVLCVLPVLVLFTSLVRKGMLKAQLKTKALEGNVNKILLENVENIEQLKANKALHYATDKYDMILSSHFKASQASNFYDAVFSPVMQIIKNAVLCGVLLLCGYNLGGVFGMSIGAVIAALSLLTDLFAPIENLGMEIQTIQKSVAAVKRINGFFKMSEEPEKTCLNLKNTEIVYENVSFAYGEKEVIKNFSLTVCDGERIALQGPSGVGKSTILKLAMGLIKPGCGTVTIGGRENYLFDSDMRKELFAIVYQDPFFSGGSVYEEISLKDKTITKEQVKSALCAVGLGYVENLDERLNDKEYSSGELALFNIARVIVRDPKIIFLDEMNAKIDPVTGKQIIRLIENLSMGKTVISINHYGEALSGARVIKLG